MALPINTSGDVGLDRALSVLDARLAALEAQAGSGASAASAAAQSVVAPSGGLLTVRDVAQATVLFVEGVEFDTADGFAVSQDDDFARIDRTASVTVPTATAGASAAGTATEAANADHVHLLKVPQLSADPASPTDGEIWYRTDLDKLSVRTGGATKRSAVFT